MNQILLIAVGGATGAVLRFVVSGWVYSMLGRDFPYGTLVVNVFGSLVMGLCFALLVERMMSGPEWRAFLMVGLLGALTTFSTFSIETLNLLEDGELFKAFSNVMASVLLCLLGAWVGVMLGRQ